MHNDWYICESIPVGKTETRLRIELILDFYNGDPDVLDRCTFLLHPIPQSESKFKNCKGMIGPDPRRMINGQPLPSAPPLITLPEAASQIIGVNNKPLVTTPGVPPGNTNASAINTAKSAGGRIAPKPTISTKTSKCPYNFLITRKLSAYWRGRDFSQRLIVWENNFHKLLKWPFFLQAKCLKQMKYNRAFR